MRTKALSLLPALRCQTVSGSTPGPPDGADILWAAGAQPFELPSGKALTLKGWDQGNYGMLSLVKHDKTDVILLCGVGEHCGREPRE